mgnify:CR=1 FL=1
MKYLFLLLFAAFILLIGVPTSEAELGPDLALVGALEATEGGGQSVTISGDYAYFTYNGGFGICNIQNPLDLNIVGHYHTGDHSHPAYSIAISGNYAYLVIDYHIMVIDVEEPANPTLVAIYSHNEMQYPKDIFISGNYAYVADSQKGLFVFEIEESANLVLVGRWGADRNYYGVTISENYAYLSGAQGLDLVYIEDPSNPAFAGNYYIQNSNYAKETIISEGYAYVSYTGDGAYIINISNPNNPTLVVKLKNLTEGGVWGVAISGNHAYLANRVNGVTIINIEDLSNPTLIISYGYTYDEHNSSLLHHNEINDIAISNNYLYIVDYERGLIVFGLDSDKDGFSDLIDEFPSNGAEWIDNDKDGIGDNQDTDDDNDGLSDIDENYSGTNSSRADTDGDGYCDGALIVEGACIGGDVFPVDYNEWVDTDKDGFGDNKDFYPNDPNKHTAGPNLALVGIYDHRSGDTGTRSVAISGNYAYIAENYDGVVVINIENPANPTFVTQILESGNAVDIAISGNYAYVANYNGGLLVLNIEDPSNPIKVGEYDTTSSASGVTISGNYAYIAEGTIGFEIINIEDPSNPTKIGKYNTPGTAMDITISNEHAYVADYEKGMTIVDIGDPSNPVQVARISDNNLKYAQSIFISGDYAYAANGGQGVYIIDIRDINSPRVIQEYSTRYSAHSIFVAGEYAYVADGEDGLNIIQISGVNTDSSHILVGLYNSHYTTYYANGIVVSGDYFYVIDTHGLHIFGIDADNDGYANEFDAFPNDNTEWFDTDNDGVGDNSDILPRVSSISTLNDMLIHTGIGIVCAGIFLFGLARYNTMNQIKIQKNKIDKIVNRLKEKGAKVDKIESMLKKN